MTLFIKSIRKVVVIGWTTGEGDGEWVIKGGEASISAGGEEKRIIKNDGESNLFFPIDFVGDVEVTVRGSHSGEETSTLHVK